MDHPLHHVAAIVVASFPSEVNVDGATLAKNTHQDAGPPYRIQSIRTWIIGAIVLVVCSVAGVRLIDSRAAVPESSQDSQWRQLAPGLESRRSVVVAPSTSLPVPFHVVRADPLRYMLRVVDSRTFGERAMSTQTLATRAAALVTLNANFFLEDYSPLGLILTDGSVKNPLRKADWGVFTVSKSGTARMEHTRDWKHRDDDEFAVQAGPRLVVNGKILTLKPNLARRSALCIDQNGRILLIATSGLLLLDEFATILQRPEHDSGFSCKNALNLDGGSSTQLFVAAPEAGVGVESDSPVPIAVGVFPRPVK